MIAHVLANEEQTMSQLQLSLLGEPSVKHGEHTLTFSTRKPLTLLVYLDVEGGTQTPKTLNLTQPPDMYTLTCFAVAIYHIHVPLVRKEGTMKRTPSTMKAIDWY